MMLLIITLPDISILQTLHTNVTFYDFNVPKHSTNLNVRRIATKRRERINSMVRKGKN